jgi:hypothetical protein
LSLIVTGWNEKFTGRILKSTGRNGESTEGKIQKLGIDFDSFRVLIGVRDGQTKRFLNHHTMLVF